MATPTISNSYVGDGSTVLYSFTFPYIETSDIRVSLDSVETTEYLLANATTIQLITAPAAGVVVEIFRLTDNSDLKSVFFPGSAIRARDLNDNFTQSLYVVQEARAVADVTIGDSAAALAAAEQAAADALTAQNAATAAQTQADAASTAATNAQGSATDALAQANAASTSATDSATQAAAAQASAANAVTQAANAANSASDAASDAADASTDAATSIATANAAATLATTADGKADTALAEASASSTSAAAAQASASAAQASATQAQTDASQAQSDATQAQTDASAAQAAAAAAQAAAEAVEDAVVEGGVVSVNGSSGVVTLTVGDLTNDAGYITSADVPTSNSGLTNDAGYITNADLPTDNAELTNGAGYITLAEVPVSSIDDLSDVTTSGTDHTPVDGQSLVWNEAHGHWMPGIGTPKVEQLANFAYYPASNQITFVGPNVQDEVLSQPIATDSYYSCTNTVPGEIWILWRATNTAQNAIFENMVAGTPLTMNWTIRALDASAVVTQNAVTFISFGPNSGSDPLESFLKLSGPNYDAYMGDYSITLEGPGIVDGFAPVTTGQALLYDLTTDTWRPEDVSLDIGSLPTLP